MGDFSVKSRTRSTLKALLRKAGHISVPAASRAEVLQSLSLLRPLEADCGLIRVGSDNDGGYLVPDDLDGIYCCFSPGVGWTTAFEDHLQDDFGIPSFLADLTKPNGCRHPVDHIYIRHESTDDGKSLVDWIQDKDLPNGVDLLMQMDIEGAEWPVLMSTPRDVLNRFRIIVVEYHYLERLADEYLRFHMLHPVLHKMNELFVAAHVHANNAVDGVRLGSLQYPRVVEVTYLRRDRFVEQGTIQFREHPLDQLNDPARPPLGLGAILSDE